MNRIQVAKPKARRKQPGHELLSPDPFDPDIVRAKALARAARPTWQNGAVVSWIPPTVTSARKSGDAFPPELRRLLGTAQQVIDQHVNREGRCAVCGSPWPCCRAELAEFTLGAL